jgi:hypothetical protein
MPNALTVYHIVFWLCSLAGLVFHGYFFAFHLLHFALNNDVLSRVFKAITSSGSQLGWLALLALIIIYLFTLIAFAFMRHSFDENEGMFCDDMFHCLVTMVNYGLRADGGVGEVLPPHTYDWRESEWRAFFDLAFWVIITIVGLNIVFTVIVGIFAKLREEKSMIQEDLGHVCLICSLQSHEFERFAKGFKHHVTEEHNIFNYLWFMMHVLTKDETMFTSHELYFYNMLTANDLSVFPINRAMSLVHRSDSDINNILQDIGKTMVNIVHRAKRVDLDRAVAEERRLVRIREANIKGHQA